MTLIGPKPKDQPVFPTPWSIEYDNRVVDATGNTLFSLSSDHASEEADSDLTELIVNLINATCEEATVAAADSNGYEYFIQRFDSGIEPNVYRVRDEEVWVQYYPGNGFHNESDYSASEVRAQFPRTEF